MQQLKEPQSVRQRPGVGVLKLLEEEVQLHIVHHGGQRAHRVVEVHLHDLESLHLCNVRKQNFGIKSGGLRFGLHVTPSRLPHLPGPAPPLEFSWRGQSKLIRLCTPKLSTIL